MCTICTYLTRAKCGATGEEWPGEARVALLWLGNVWNAVIEGGLAARSRPGRSRCLARNPESRNRDGRNRRWRVVRRVRAGLADRVPDRLYLRRAVDRGWRRNYDRRAGLA